MNGCNKSFKKSRNYKNKRSKKLINNKIMINMINNGKLFNRKIL